MGIKSPGTKCLAANLNHWKMYQPPLGPKNAPWAPMRSILGKNIIQTWGYMAKAIKTIKYSYINNSVLAFFLCSLFIFSLQFPSNLYLCLYPLKISPLKFYLNFLKLLPSVIVYCCRFSVERVCNHSPAASVVGSPVLWFKNWLLANNLQRSS